jgi:hypothetical protein
MVVAAGLLPVSVLFEDVQARQGPPVDLHEQAASAQWPDIDRSKAEFVKD